MTRSRVCWAWFAMTGLLGLAVLTAVAASGPAAAAAPQPVATDGYAVSVFHNNTPFRVGGSLQWGNDPPISLVLESGERKMTWRPLTLFPVPLRIHFDADPGPGEDWVHYNLRTYVSPTTMMGPPTEVFYMLPNGRVDLRNVRG